MRWQRCWKIYFTQKAHSLLSQITQQLEHPIFTNVNGEYLEDKTVAFV